MSGIVAQYGFEYQKMVFIESILKTGFSPTVKFSFEKNDDVDISDEDSICKVDSVDQLIQVKSGKVSQEVLYKVIGNWLISVVTPNKYVLCLENALEFDYKETSFLDGFIAAVDGAKESRTTRILKKVYDKYEKCMGQLKDNAKEIVEKIVIEIKSMQEIEQSISSLYISNFCSDIINYSSLCERRTKELIDSIVAKIGESMRAKKPYILNLSDFIDLNRSISERFNEAKYEIDINDFKKKNENKAKALIEDGINPEIQQLKSVYDSENAILRQMINKLLYEDVKSAFEGTTEFNNVEYQAKENHTEVIDFNGENLSAKDLFKMTIEKVLDIPKVPKHKVFSDGCYIHLTSDSAKNEYKIWWKKDEV